MKFCGFIGRPLLPMAVLGSALLAGTTLAQIDRDIIAYSGAPAVGTQGQVYSFFGVPQISQAGEIYFSSYTGSDPTSLEDGGTWVWTQAGIQKLIHTQDELIGYPAGSFLRFPPSPLGTTDDGRVLVALLIDRSTAGLDTQVALAIASLDSIETVIATDTRFPGLELFINNLEEPAISATGMVLARMSSVGIIGSSLIRGDANDLELVIGQFSPSPPDGVEGDARLFYFRDIESTPDGIISFTGQLTGTDIVSSNNGGIWVGYPDSLEFFALEGMQAPGLETGITFRDIQTSIGSQENDFEMNANGSCVFRGLLAGPGVTNSSTTSLWLGQPGDIQMIARGGQPAPGLSAGTNFKSLRNPSIDDNGNVYFHATLEGPGIVSSNDEGIWRYNASGTFDRLINDGDVVNTPTGTVTITGITPRVLHNNSGQIVCWVTLNNTGSTPTPPDAILVTDTSGKPHIIVKETEIIDVNPDPNITDERTVKFPRIDMTDSSFALNDDGRLCFHVEFEDETLALGTARTITPSGCLPDTNNDGLLTPADFTAWIDAFNNDRVECDQNSDNTCSPTDFSAWIANYNAGCD